MLATVAWRDEAGQACQYDIVRSQVRIELCTPNGGGKEKQDNTDQFTPGGFLCQCQTQDEEQGEPS